MKKIEEIEMAIDERTVKAANAAGLDPEVLDYHVEGIHGWETHDQGFEKGLAGAVECLLKGGCTNGQGTNSLDA